jgi:hypothetical protein
MKTTGVGFAAAVAAFCLASAPAHAAVQETAKNGHWLWVSDPIIGPKSTAANRHRIWVSDQPAVAGHWQWVTELSFGPRNGVPMHHKVWVSDRS